MRKYSRREIANRAIAVACFAFDCIQQQNPWKLSSQIHSICSPIPNVLFISLFLPLWTRTKATIHHKIFILSNNVFIVPNLLSALEHFNKKIYVHNRNRLTVVLAHLCIALKAMVQVVQFRAKILFALDGGKHKRNWWWPQTLQNVSEFSSEISYCGRWRPTYIHTHTARVFLFLIRGFFLCCELNTKGVLCVTY